MKPRVLVLSTVYPNDRQPTLGVFVHERMRRVAKHCQLVVVAPVPWFPFNSRIRGRQLALIPRVEHRDGVLVYHPRVFCVPRYLKWLDGFFYAASLVPFLARLRRVFDFDLIDAHFAYPDGLAAALLGRLYRRPVMITLRGSIVRLATYRLHRPLLKLALRMAGRVLAVSESLKRVAGGLGIPAEKIRVIPNGVDTGRFFPRDRVEARQLLGLPVDRTILLSVGGLNEGKGHHHIVALLPELLRRRADLLYVVVGSERVGDSCRATIERLVRDHGLKPHVRLAGERPHEEIPLWLAAADVFCLATRSEGWANSLLESLACGVPVVTTNVGGNSEIVRNDVDGFLVPLGDHAALAQSIATAVERTWNRAEMVARARGHSWDHAVEHVLDEFRRLLGSAHQASKDAPARIGREDRR